MYILWQLGQYFHSLKSGLKSKTGNHVPKPCCRRFLLRIFCGELNFHPSGVTTKPQIQETSAQKKYNCQDGPPKGTNPGACCAKAKSFNETVMKQCFSDFSAIPPRPSKGIQGTMNGLEVSGFVFCGFVIKPKSLFVDYVARTSNFDKCPLISQI